MFGGRHWRREVLGLIKSLHQRFDTMGSSLDALTAQVAANDAVIGSAITLINGFAAELEAAIAAAKAGDDSAQLDALAADVKAHADALAAAVVAGTPAAPTP